MTWPARALAAKTDVGAGSALAVAVVAAIAALVAILLPLYSVFADRARIAAAADAGALAAADAVAGFTTGTDASEPCSLAATLVTEAGAVLASCVVDGLVVTVVVSDTILGLTLAQTATAGPPPAKSEPAPIR